MITGAKYVPVYQVINQAYRDMGVINDLNIADAIEWAGEAIEFIGSAPCYLNIVKTFVVRQRRVKLPVGLHYIEGIKAYPTEDLDTCPELSLFNPMRYTTDTFAHPYCENNNDVHCNSSMTYQVNNDYLNPSFNTGFVLIAYKSVAVDSNGAPLIPDDVKFKNAVSYHIQEKLAFKLLMQGKIQSDAYNIISRNRDWYIGAANTRGNAPSVDEMENLKNDWLRLIPKINHWETSFKSLGEPEQRINHTSGMINPTTGEQGDAPTFFNYTDSAEE